MRDRQAPTEQRTPACPAFAGFASSTNQLTDAKLSPEDEEEMRTIKAESGLSQ
jgi:hypothetical protein